MPLPAACTPKVCDSILYCCNEYHKQFGPFAERTYKGWKARSLWITSSMNTPSGGFTNNLNVSHVSDALQWIFISTSDERG
ncbi:hypothetical protein CC2G_015089 [Coprinopsis cinerea AmutBmut pab1-1]|nr:hypothetical protein CC2G_004021 [Coprinopsis cinerea AmutBmut pab1-1]KAG2007395.1 hypothetical protein CC2G_015089 [Coprinopsis cinerea AmutBmut pab1-1]